jgi:hypothetical protein
MKRRPRYRCGEGQEKMRRQGIGKRSGIGEEKPEIHVEAKNRCEEGQVKMWRRPG